MSFRKAFDSTNHDILKKLARCGVSGDVLEILCDYWNDQSQYVDLIPQSQDIT